MRPLSIAYLSREYPPHPLGGVGSYTAAMASAMAAEGHDVHVISCVPGQVPSDEADGDVLVHRRPTVMYGTPQPGDSLGLRLATAASAARAVLRSDVQFDIVESPDHMAEGLGLSLLRRQPVVVCLHDGDRLSRERSALDRIERALVRRATAWRAPSRFIVEGLASRGWVDEGSVEVLAVPFEADLWPVTPVPPGHPVVVVVGRVQEVKAPEVVVRAVASLARQVPDVEVVFVGQSLGARDGRPYAEWLDGLARALGARCRFTGEVPADAVAGWYAAARVVVLPGWSDNQPMAGLEAMASGRPVVCTSSTGTAELVGGSGAGSVVPPGDAPALARALVPFLTGPETAASAGRLGRNLVEGRFCPRQAAAAAEAFYRKAIRRWAGTAP
jgi:glycosyltransferase involved in cell wall biosynthesis